MQRPTVRQALVASLAFLVVIGAAAAFVIVRMRSVVPSDVFFAERVAPHVLWLARALPTTPVSEPGTTPPPAPGAPCAKEPPLEHEPTPTRTSVELVAAFREDPTSLGPVVLGTPTRGSLLNAVALRESATIGRAGNHPYGTRSVVRAIERGVREVNRCFPRTQRITVGDLSKKQGGWLSPHRSHQAGLDADIGYYYTDRPTWFEVATRKNLDVARTWALMRALIDGGNVEMIFVDRGVQAILREHVEKLPEEQGRLGDLFESPLKKDAMLRHAWGHATHFHVRFRDPDATALGLALTRSVPQVELALVASGRRIGQKPRPPRPKPKVAPPKPRSKAPPTRPGGRAPPKR